MNQFVSQSEETEGRSEGEEKSQEEERESVPKSEKEKNPLCSILETSMLSLLETATSICGTNFTAALGATSQVDNTPLTTTWELCNSVNENVMQNAGENIAPEHNGQIPGELQIFMLGRRGCGGTDHGYGSQFMYVL